MVNIFTREFFSLVSIPLPRHVSFTGDVQFRVISILKIQKFDLIVKPFSSNRILSRCPLDSFQEFLVLIHITVYDQYMPSNIYFRTSHTYVLTRKRRKTKKKTIKTITTLACLPNYRSPINCLFERVRFSTETFSLLSASAVIGSIPCSRVFELLFIFRALFSCPF